MGRRLLRDRRGSVSLLAAGGLVVAIGGLSFAADVGSTYLAGRRLQGIADAASLSAAADLSLPLAQAQATVVAAGWSGQTIDTSVATGTWTSDSALGARFTAGAASPDAAQVTLATDAPLYFGRLFGRSSIRLTRRATSLRADMAAFSLGSRLAAVDGGIANALLSGLAGTTITLTAADYQALIGTDLDLLALASAVRGNAATSFDQAFATARPASSVLSSIAATLEAGGSTAAAAAVRKVATGASAMAPVAPAALASLGPIGRQDHAAPGQTVKINAWDTVRGLMEAAGGPRQIRLSLAGTVPGLTAVTAYLAIGSHSASSPWVTITAKGDTVVRTAQSRLYLDTSVLTSGTLATLYLVPQVRLPLYVELAQAEAKLSSVGCRGGARTASLLVKPSLGHASIAEVSTTAATFADQSVALTENAASIVSVGAPLVAISGQSRTDVSGTGFQTVSFSAVEIASLATKTVSSGQNVTGIAGSLVGKTSLTVQVGPLKLPSPAIGALVGGTLSAAAPLVDGLLGTLTDLLGTHLGQADVRVNGLRCGVPVLVA